MKNDKLMVLEADNKETLNNQKVEELIKNFKEELRPIGIACKTWAKC